MADQGAETPVQPEHTRYPLAERMERRLALFWQRVGPQDVYKRNLQTLQETHDALGPGKAQEVMKTLDPFLKGGAMAGAAGVTAGEIVLGVLANTFVRRLTGFIPFSTAVVGGTLVGIGGMEVAGERGRQAGIETGVRGGSFIGETIRTPIGIAAGVGVAELGIAHTASSVIDKRIVRPLNVRVAQLVGRITRGWDTPKQSSF